MPAIDSLRSVDNFPLTLIESKPVQKAVLFGVRAAFYDLLDQDKFRAELDFGEPGTLGKRLARVGFRPRALRLCLQEVDKRLALLFGSRCPELRQHCHTVPPPQENVFL